MANESRVINIASELRPKILADTRFIAEQSVIMPALVDNYTGQGMALRYFGKYPQGTAAVVGEGSANSAYTQITKTLEATSTPEVVQITHYITDERMMTDPENVGTTAARIIGNAIGRKIDTDLVGTFTSASASKGTAGSALTITSVAAAIAVLRKNSIPNPHYVVVHPYQWHDVWVELGQPATNKAFLGDLANQAMRDYFVGDALGAMWFTDANITSGTAAVGAVFAREAIVLDTRDPIDIEMERDAERRSTIVVGHAIYDAVLRSTDHIVKLIADSTEPT